MNIFLVGCRGSGKSTVGPLLAKRLGWQFVDLDERIIADAGCSITEIFAREGEEGFRRREQAECQKLKKLKDVVVALGGGTTLDPINLSLIKRTGKIVWLRAPAAVLWSRINMDPHTAHNRPNLTAKGGLAELEATLAQRESHYASCANQIIDVLSESPDDVAEAIQIWFDANDTNTR